MISMVTMHATMGHQPIGADERCNAVKLGRYMITWHNCKPPDTLPAHDSTSCSVVTCLT